MWGNKFDKVEIRDWIIYRITSPTNRIYIGKTVNFRSRKSNYKCLTCKHQTVLYKSLKKYGFENHKMEVIDTFKANLSEANSKEMFWIRTYMSNQHKYPKMRGMNLTDGGEGIVGNKASAETRKKQSLAKIGKPTHNKGKKGIQVAWNKGLKGTHVAWNKGKSYSHLTSEERKLKFGTHNLGNSYNKGRKQSAEFIVERIRKQTGKPLPKKMIPIVQYTLNGEFVREFAGIKIAAKELNIHQSRIVDSLLNKIKNPKEYIYKYKKDCIFTKHIFQRRIFKQQEIKVA